MNSRKPEIERSLQKNPQIYFNFGGPPCIKGNCLRYSITKMSTLLSTLVVYYVGNLAPLV